MGSIYVLVGWTCADKTGDRRGNSRVLSDDPRVKNAFWILLAPIGIFALRGIENLLSNSGINAILMITSYFSGVLLGGALFILTLSYTLIRSSRMKTHDFAGEKIDVWLVILEYLHNGYESAKEKISSHKKNSWNAIRKRDRSRLKEYSSSISLITYTISSHLSNPSSKRDPHASKTIKKSILINIVNCAREYCITAKNLSPELNANYMIAIKKEDSRAEHARTQLTFPAGEETISKYNYLLLLQEYADRRGSETFSVLASDAVDRHLPLLPGAPAAFHDKVPKLVNTKQPDFAPETPDELKIAVNEYFTKKLFNSFVSIPIFSGKQDERCLGIVNIESPLEDFAELNEGQLSALYALLTPFTALLGLLLDADPPPPDAPPPANVT